MKASGRVVRAVLPGQAMEAIPRYEAEHGWAWTLKVNGKVASGTDVHKRALIRRADQLTLTGRGGGVVALLMPQSEKEVTRLQRDRVT